MNTNQLIHALTAGTYYTIGVRFYQNGDGCFFSDREDASGFNDSCWSDKTYVYKVRNDLELKVGDNVVVAVGNELKVVRVFEVHTKDEEEIDYESSIEYKWTLGKVDTASHLEQIEKDKKGKAELKKLLVRRAREQALLEITKELGGIDNVKQLLGIDSQS